MPPFKKPTCCSAAADVERVRKRFGQHFLHDPAVISKIVAVIDPRPDETFVEIGPGRGVLTRPLAERVRQLFAIEIDRDLAATLADRFPDNTNVKIITGDALKTDFRAFGSAFRLVGNLPYNISTPLLFHLIDFRDVIVDGCFMLQKEVVDRMAAASGSKTYGRLSVMIQSYWQVTPLFDVGAGAFSPPPKITSAIVRLTPRNIELNVENRPAFDKIVMAAFGQRRKTLRNSLASILTESAIRAAGIDPGARVEAVDLEQFVELSRQTSYKCT